MNQTVDSNKKIIIVAEDDYTSFALLQVLLAKYECELVHTINGKTNEIFTDQSDLDNMPVI